VQSMAGKLSCIIIIIIIIIFSVNRVIL